MVWYKECGIKEGGISEGGTLTTVAELHIQASTRTKKQKNRKEERRSSCWVVMIMGRGYGDEATSPIPPPNPQKYGK